MYLTDEQQAILNGSQGETMAKVWKTLVMYGEAFGADKMVLVTSSYNHLVTSFGLKMMKPVFQLMQQLIDAGVTSGQKFSVDPRPVDKNVPANLLQNIIFNKIMYATQDYYEGQLNQLGLMDKDAFTCACYLDQVGNKPRKGEILSWAESSAVVYANSGFHRRLCAQLRPAYRRRPPGYLDRKGGNHQKTRGTAAGQRHRHEGDGGCSFYHRYVQVAGY